MKNKINSDLENKEFKYELEAEQNAIFDASDIN